jgi:hypothetical protein
MYDPGGNMMVDNFLSALTVAARIAWVRVW